MTLESEFRQIVTLNLYRCSPDIRHVLHFCTLKAGQCGWRKGRENRWLHIYIPEEWPLQCAFKPSQVTSTQTLRLISKELHQAIPNLRELRIFVGLPHNNPRTVAYIR